MLPVTLLLLCSSSVVPPPPFRVQVNSKFLSLHLENGCSLASSFLLSLLTANNRKAVLQAGCSHSFLIPTPGLASCPLQNVPLYTFWGGPQLIPWIAQETSQACWLLMVFDFCVPLTPVGLNHLQPCFPIKMFSVCMLCPSTLIVEVYKGQELYRVFIISHRAYREPRRRVVTPHMLAESVY